MAGFGYHALQPATLLAKTFKSKEAKISYDASFKEAGESSTIDFETYQQRWLKLFIENAVKEAIEKYKVRATHKEYRGK